MIGIVLGGLLVTAVFLYPALQLKKRGKWSIILGILMFLAGIGLVGIAFWAAGLFSGSLTLTLIVGGVALVLAAGFVMAIIADVADGKLDRPWFVFAIPALLAVLLVTGTQTFDYIGQQIAGNADRIGARMGQ
jgi:hypothetical protein